MTDYDTMTDYQLCWEVAEAKGWTDLYWYDCPISGRWLLGIDPDGNEGATPDWLRSLDACWRDLMPREGITIDAFRPDEEYEPPMVMMCGCDEDDPPRAIDRNPARAWCLAWLRLMSRTCNVSSQEGSDGTD